MRAAAGTKTATAATHRTIDLTATRPMLLEHAVSDRSRDAVARDRAISSFRVTQRRRRARGAVDSMADAIMATGGVTLANVAMRLDLGLPRGIGGIVLGTAFLAAGALIATAHRTKESSPPNPGASMRPHRVIVLENQDRVITLDSDARVSAVASHHAA